MAAPRVDRRLAAILAADVAGYSRLMERDEGGTVARLKAIRKELVEPVLERHGGRFVDLKGDGAIVEFGSAVAAVEPAGRHRVKNISEPVETWRVRLDGTPARRGVLAWAARGRRPTRAVAVALG